MFQNYLITALRAMARRKLFALVNIVGLATGMAVFLLSQLYAGYETGYDRFFADHERIFVIESLQKPGWSTPSTLGGFAGLRGFLSDHVNEAELSARHWNRAAVLGVDDTRFHQLVRFVDPDFFRIFDFELLAGSLPDATSGPEALVLTRTAADRYCGGLDCVGQTITLDNRLEARVTGVIADLPGPSHMVNPLFDLDFDVIATMPALSLLHERDYDHDWDTVNTFDFTYVKLRPGIVPASVQPSLDRLYEAVPPGGRVSMRGYRLRPLTEANGWMWDAAGIPVIESIQLLGLLVLLVAAINYTNLAAAQTMGRAREVGLRKVMGARRRQLLTQFITESIALAFLALVVALAGVELLLPIINAALDQSIAWQQLGAGSPLIVLVLLAIAVGLISGAYPAFLIQKPSTIALLKSTARGGRGGRLVRGALLVVQFSVSLLLVIMVAVIGRQNARMEQAAALFDKEQTIVLEQLQAPEAVNKKRAIVQSLERIDGVNGATLHSTIPLSNSNNTSQFASRRNLTEPDYRFNVLGVDPDFHSLYGFQLLAGRDFIDADMPDIRTDTNLVPVVINQLARVKLGYESDEAAIGQQFFGFGSNERIYEVVGVTIDVNFLGLFNAVKPFVHLPSNRTDNLSLRLAPGFTRATVAEIDAVWRAQVPELPIKRRFLDDYFNDIYQILAGLNRVLGAFAVVALLLATVGLFSMTAFSAMLRAPEIAVRRVLGASIASVTRMMMWQFLRPVVLALLIAIPLAYFAGTSYLNFFADRVSLGPDLFLRTGGFGLLLALATVAYHAIRVARAHPVTAIRYE